MFKLGDKLGRGKTSVAYQCTEKATNKQVCIKVVNLQFMELCGEAVTEVKLLRKLNHPNIVQVLDVFQDEDNMYISLQLCKGGTLGKRIEQHGPLSEREAVSVMAQLLEAVNYMHKKAISHRDLKPENILFLDEIRTSIKLIDFGFSKDLLTQIAANTLTGTLDYCAPEILQRRSYDYLKIDCWSIGCICYFLLFGVTPFHDKVGMAFLCIAALNGDYSLETDKIDPSPEAKSFIKSLLNPNEFERSTAEMALNHKWILDNV